MLDGWYYVEKYHRKTVACYCYQELRQTTFSKKNFTKYSQIGCFKVRNSTRNSFTLWQSPSSNMFQKRSFTGEITGNLAHRSPPGNMHKLFDCIKNLLNFFLAFLRFIERKYDFVICIREQTLDPPLVYSIMNRNLVILSKGARKEKHYEWTRLVHPKKHWQTSFLRNSELNRKVSGVNEVRVLEYVVRSKVLMYVFTGKYLFTAFSTSLSTVNDRAA